MAMPIRLIYHVKISLRQKAGLVCLFGLGFFMIAFAITRAKQVLVEQYFVNLTLLMIWSTLIASVCECSPSSPIALSRLHIHSVLTATPILAVIVGSLPTLKILI